MQGRPARVHMGGSGSPILLVHGGWADAEFHWSRVWSLLAKRHLVIAPDLPGLGAIDQPPLTSVGAYADWVVALLDVLGVERACFVGNSFGASLAWAVARRAPGRCSGLVLINGFPMPATPWALGVVGRAPLAKAIMGRVVRRFIYTPASLPRAFADPRLVPSRMERLMAEAWPVIVPNYVEVLIAGDGGPPPPAKPLLLWGAADRLPGSNLEDAKRLQQTLQGSTLKAIEGVGHFPQLEAPQAFVDALEAFVG